MMRRIIRARFGAFPFVSVPLDHFADCVIDAADVFGFAAGLGNPRSVTEAVSEVRKVIDPAVAISLHLHDTRGLGLANMVAGLQVGVSIFDTALAGLGGCPFVPNAAGNIATEDAVYALNELDVETGIDWQALCGLTLELEEILQRRLPGRMAHVLEAA